MCRENDVIKQLAELLVSSQSFGYKTFGEMESLLYE